MLGSASANPSDHRFPTAFALEADNRVYLLDCGAPVSTLFRTYGWRPSQLERIFLTHFHPDHVAGLSPLIVQQLMEGRVSSLPIVGPPGTSRRIPALLELGFLFADHLAFPLPLENAAIGVAYGDYACEVSFFPTTHLSPVGDADALRSHPTEYVSYGMAVKTCGHTIIYSGDVGSIHDVEPYLRGCSLLIHEFGHVNPDELAVMAEEQSVPALLVSHLHHNWTDRLPLLQEIISSRYKGTVWLAHDGLTLAIQRGHPIHLSTGSSSE